MTDDPIDQPTIGVEGIDPEDLASTADSPTVQMPAEGAGGSTVGQFRLIQRIGEGGMGEVWEADQLAPVRRRVAYKVIRKGMDSDEVVARFETERQALALMDSPFIAKVFDAGVTSRGRPFFVMEYVPGVPINEHCDQNRLSTRERLELFIRVCEGVQHAHHKAIIHRDLKPSNVLVAVQDGEAVPKIIDFGVAKATTQRLTEKTMYTEMGQMLGTPEYMSPEQAEMSGQNIDTRTDVYSLGVMLYYLLVGALPFDAKELRSQPFDEIRRRIREDEPPRPSTHLTRLSRSNPEGGRAHSADLAALQRQLKGDLDWIVLKAIEKDRNRRYGSPSELAADIRRYLDDEPVLATPPSALYKMHKFVRRHRYGVATATTLLILLLAFAVTMTVQAGRIARERDRANQEAETAHRVSGFLEGLFQVSDPDEARGSRVTAREILDQGAVRIRAELADQPRVQARLMGVMGRVYRSLGLYEQARPLLEEAVSVQSEQFGDGNVEVAGVLNDLGNLLRNTGAYDEAQKLLERSLAIREAELGPDNEFVAMNLSDLGNLHMVMGHQDQAREMLERSLAISEKVQGADHPDVATALNNLAILDRRERKYDSALQRYQRAREILEQRYGSDHPDVANVLNNMAVVQQRLGQTRNARRSFERALEIREQVLGPEHPDVASTLNNLANLEESDGRFPEARRLHERALAIREAALGPDHPDVAQSLQNLATTVRATGDYAAAQPLYEKALATYERALGPRHQKVALSHYNLGCLLALRGDREGALEELSTALDLGFSYPGMRDDPDLDSLKGNAEFESLARAAAVRPEIP